MLDKNIFEVIYRFSPFCFYEYLGENETVIKSLHNRNLGYKFNKKFSENELVNIWEAIHFCRYFIISGAIIGFLMLMYGLIFPNFQLFLKIKWYFNIIIFIGIFIVLSWGLTYLCNIKFKNILKNKFGEFEKTKFTLSKMIDNKYYKKFKFEIIRILGFLIILITLFNIISPLKMSKQYILNQDYKKVDRIISIGSKLFPILPDWYSLRGYSEFQQGKFDEAIEDYDKAYRLGSDEFKVMSFDNKIFIRYYLKDYEDALNDFDKEMLMADDEYEKDAILWDKAQFLYNISRYQESLDLYSQLLLKADDDSVYLLKDRLYLERAQIYQKLGKIELAKSDLINSGAMENLESPIDAIPKPMLLINEL